MADFKKMMFYSIVIFTALGLPGMIQLDDKWGPYNDITVCYQRGSAMIKEVISSGKFPPVVQAQALCVDMKNLKKPDKQT
jgi:hypothetical protein